MKTKHIFWGLFFVSIGVLILLNNLGTIYFDLTNIWKFWPVIFILWGVSYFTNNNIVKGFIAGLAAIVLAVVIFACCTTGFHFVTNEFSFDDDDFGVSFFDGVDTSNYYETYDSNIKYADFSLEAGAGSFLLKDSTENLVSATVQGLKNNYELNREDSGSRTSINLKMLKKHFNFHHDHERNKAVISLNTKPIWNLNFGIGAASSNFDLTPFNVENVSLNTGAATVKMKLGNKSDETHVSVRAGASDVEISVPESSGCEIKVNSTLSSKDFNGFNKINSNVYQTDNFDSAKKKVYIDLSTGVSSLKVDRYSSNW